MKNKLFEELPEDETYIYDDIYLIGDSILNQFYNGNWSATVQKMIDNSYTTSDLIEFINHLEDDESPTGWYDWFDRAFFAELGNSKVKLN